MSEIYNPPDAITANAWVNSMDEYRKMYQRSIEEPEAFWADMADQFVWFEKWRKVRDYNYNVNDGDIRIEWFQGGKTNITANCLDRHLATRGDQAAIVWEGNEPGETRK